MKSSVLIKAHRPDQYILENIKAWIEIFDHVTIVCPQQHRQDFQDFFPDSIVFPDFSIDFLKKQYSLIHDIISEKWRGAFIGHFSSINFSPERTAWIIDGDSITKSLSETPIKESLQAVEEYFHKEDLDLFSLDFWRTSNQRSFLDHWSFGICLQKVKLPNLYFNSFLENKESFKSPWGNNIDYIFDEMREQNIGRIKTFAIVDSFLNHRDAHHVFGRDIKTSNQPCNIPYLQIKKDYVLFHNKQILFER